MGPAMDVKERISIPPVAGTNENHGTERPQGVPATVRKQCYTASPRFLETGLNRRANE